MLCLHACRAGKVERASVSIRLSRKQTAFIPAASCPRSYYECKELFARLRVPMFPPGRIMLLRRLKPARQSSSQGGSSNNQAPSQPPLRHQDGQDGRQGGSALAAAGSMQQEQAGGAAHGGQQAQAGSGQRGQHWDAVWVQAEALLSEGILLSR